MEPVKGLTLQLYILIKVSKRDVAREVLIENKIRLLKRQDKH